MAGEGEAGGADVGPRFAGTLAATLSFPLAAGDGEAGAAAADSSTAISVPSLTLSPTFSFISLIVPAAGAGTSIVALSDSSVTSESSAATVSPGFTKTSMTGTSLKSPMSGTLTVDRRHL